MSNFRKPLKGIFLLSWRQTLVDRQVPETIGDIAEGAIWSWKGEPVALDLRGPGEDGDDEARRLAAAALARRMLGRALELEGVEAAATDESQTLAFVVSDGIRDWTILLLPTSSLSAPLVLFAGDGPPADRRLMVRSKPRLIEAPAVRQTGRGMVCFTPGTRIATPDGPRAVETLLAGDKVATRDSGPQEVLWIGQKEMSGARLYAMPDLRPVRIRSGALGEDRPEGDLLVSPDHRILVTGDRARAIWGEPEVLVAARDLIDDGTITRDHGAGRTSYIHLLLPSHQILCANGLDCESFHPADADLDHLGADQRSRLFDLMPTLAETPALYGARARSVLSSAEAALLAARVPH